MKNEKRLFIPGVLNHCYQNTPNGALIFYSVRDYLVLLSIIYIASKRYDVVLLAVCFMPDHLHSSSVAESLEEFSGFYGFVTSTFAREMNKEYGFRGPVFNAPFGSVPKIGDKKSKDKPHICVQQSRGEASDRRSGAIPVEFSRLCP